MPARLGKHGVSVLWQQIALFKVVPNTRIGGQPAHVEVVNADASGRGWCSALGGQRVIEAAIQEPATANTWFAVATCLRGPKLAASHAAVNQMLASVRFRTRTTTP